MAATPSDRVVTDRLIIRREVAHDASAIGNAIRRNQFRLHPWMEWAVEEAGSVEAQLARITEADREWRAGLMFDYGIFDRWDSSFLGKIGMHRRIGPGGIELGYWLDASAEGRGIVTEAVVALIDEATKLDGTHRIEIHCDAANLRSQQVPLRLGFTLDRIEDRPVAAESETGRHMVWTLSISESP